jgi:hypothetical protein
VTTIIDIEPSVHDMLIDNSSPYYKRIPVSIELRSNILFDRLTAYHLGFRARSGMEVRQSNDEYFVYADLEPETSAFVKIKPFYICFVNVGDSFLKVNVRMQRGMQRCKMTVLQEKYQPKAPKEVDDFIKYEGIWYATVTINCLQTIRIEELKGDN